MKSSTKTREIEQRMLEEWQEPNSYQMMGMTAEELEQSAKESGAIKRKRKIREGVGLLRMVQVYVTTEWSLRLVAMWSKLKGVGELSDVGVLYRLRQSVDFLGRIVALQLQAQNEYLREMKGVRVKLQDGMVVSRPGSKGTDWRMHIRMDLGRMCLTGAQLSDCHGAEGLQRFAVDPEEIVIGDRGHAVARGIGWILAGMGQMVIRIGWTSLQLKDETGKRIGLIGWLNGLSESCERIIQLDTPNGRFSLRLIACKLPEEKAKEGRERVRQRAKKDGKEANPNSLTAAGFVMLITNLPLDTWSMERVLWLYRLRWQVELQFKRLKSLLHFDDLRAHDEKLAQVYLLGKLLLAILMDKMTLEAQEKNPELFSSTERPISYWRLVHLLWFCLSQQIVGPLPPQWILSLVSDMQCYLCEPPRRRSQQAALARQALAG